MIGIYIFFWWSNGTNRCVLIYLSMLLECVDEVFHLLFFSSSYVDKSIKKKLFWLNITFTNDKRSSYHSKCLHTHFIDTVQCVRRASSGFVWNGWFIRSHHVFRHSCFCCISFNTFACADIVCDATNIERHSFFRHFCVDTWRLRLECQEVVA